MNLINLTARERRRARIRAKISGTALKPRLSVFKSNTKISVQAIDDESGKTLASAEGRDAKAVGVELGQALLAKKIAEAVFDRGGYIYTGKVKALADGVREAGLKF